MQDSEDMLLLLDDCISWFFFFFLILVDFDTPGKQNKAFRFPLSIRYLSTNLTYPHIQSYSPHTPRKALAHALRILGRDLHHRFYASKKDKRNHKRKKRKKTQFTDPLYSLPLPFLGIEREPKPLHTLHHTTEANVTWAHRYTCTSSSDHPDPRIPPYLRIYRKSNHKRESSLLLTTTRSETKK
jgi:hypothetical protein